MFKNFLQKNKGYTLIETVVAVGIFSVIILIGINALINANEAGRKGRDLRNVIDNFNFALEDMSRNIRDGYHYHCGDEVLIESPLSCNPDNSPRVIFFEQITGIDGNASDQVGYKFTRIDSPNCGSGGVSLQYNLCKTTNGGTTWIQLNPPEIVFSSASVFSVLGAEDYPTDKQQPLATIFLSGNITYKNFTTSLSAQTTVSQRYIEI